MTSIKGSSPLPSQGGQISHPNIQNSQTPGEQLNSGRKEIEQFGVPSHMFPHEELNDTARDPKVLLQNISNVSEPLTMGLSL